MAPPEIVDLTLSDDEDEDIAPNVLASHIHYGQSAPPQPNPPPQKLPAPVKASIEPPPRGFNSYPELKPPPRGFNSYPELKPPPRGFVSYPEVKKLLSRQRTNRNGDLPNGRSKHDDSHRTFNNHPAAANTPSVGQFTPINQAEVNNNDDKTSSPGTRSPTHAFKLPRALSTPDRWSQLEDWKPPKAAEPSSSDRQAPWTSSGMLTANHNAANQLTPSPSAQLPIRASTAITSSSDFEDHPIKRRRVDDSVQKPARLPGTGHGTPYQPPEDELLLSLRRKGIPWAEVPDYFTDRTLSSLQVRFSTKLAHKLRPTAPLKKDSVFARKPEPPRAYEHVQQANEFDNDPGSPDPPALRKLTRRALGGEATPQEVEDNGAYEFNDGHSNPDSTRNGVNRDAQLARICRHRELGLPTRNGADARFDALSIKNLCYESLSLTGYLDDASGDIAAVAWSPDDRFFAAGGVVLTDENSMQYNRPKNMLVGDTHGVIKELPEHHVRRPLVETGVNSLGSMRSTQDQRLFTTVQMVGFSPDSKSLYSVSTDGKLNSYEIDSGHAEDVTFQSTFVHEGPVDLLTVGRHGLIATGCRSLQKNSINVFKNDGSGPVLHLALSSKSAGTTDGTYASALRWGAAPHQSRYLLAGFGVEKQRLFSEDSELDILGESCLFDAETGQRIDFGLPRNVFDVAWNPTLGPTAFGVASVGYGKLNYGIHSIIRLMGESDGSAGLRCSVELECPARDINDIVYCPYDQNLVAAGSTDGGVYVWDVRSTKADQGPLSTLQHNKSVSVLPHDRNRWEVDTGVRFLSWGATHDRLFSGSSDGVIKVWNPYVADGHVCDVATFSSAIMSGAFNSDHTELLIGEDRSRLNLLKVGFADTDLERFALISAPDQSLSEPAPHRSLLEKREIVFEHCGTLPIRQALQGPNYRASKSLLSTSEAQLHQQALRFQRGLFHQRNRWKKQSRAIAAELGKIPACKLDCGFVPRVEGDDGLVPDSGRAQDRIPDTHRREPPSGVQAMLRGLLAKCACGAPARPSEAGETLCERCHFTCFRCGEAAQLDPNMKETWCARCGITWAAGALGYEILRTTRKVKRSKKARIPSTDGKEEFGEAELVYYLDQATIK